MRSRIAVVFIVCLSLSACKKNVSREQPAKPVMPAVLKPDAAATPLAIPPGATQVNFAGTLDATKDAHFLLGEQKGSVFMAYAATPDRDLGIAVYRADTGERIRDEQPANPAFFMARLPETLGYLVAVKNTGAATPYTLQVEVPFTLFFDQMRTVEVTNFAPAHSVVSYLAPPTQTITAELEGATPDAYLTVHALDGRHLLKAEANSRTFTGGSGKPNEGVIITVNQGSTEGRFTLKVSAK
jgi:hypothetical protein